MRKLVNTAMALGGMVMLAGCSAGGERFAPGTWELEAWLADAAQTKATPRQRETIKLSPERAQRPMLRVVFGEFYQGVRGGEVTFKNGIIAGHLDQQAIAPFEAHKQTVTGTYAADRFEIRIAMPKIMGVQSYQFVTGRLVKPD